MRNELLTGTESRERQKSDRTHRAVGDDHDIDGSRFENPRRAIAASPSRRQVISMLVSFAESLFGADKATPAAKAQSEPESDGSVGALDDSDLDRIAAATVLIAALVVEVQDGEVSADHDIRPLGSGTMVTSDGLILTNNHVVSEDPDTALARLKADLDAEMESDGTDVELRVEEKFLIYMADRWDDDLLSREYTATIDKLDEERDLALLRITGNAKGFPLAGSVNRPYLERGDPSKIKPFDTVFLFGYPVFGDESSRIDDTARDADSGEVRRIRAGRGLGNVLSFEV